MDRCKYNLLNQQAAPVRHIEPRNDREDEEERFGETIATERYKTFDIVTNETIMTGTRMIGQDYNDDRYDRDYSPGYNQRREDQQGDYEDQRRQGYQNN